VTQQTGNDPSGAARSDALIWRHPAVHNSYNARPTPGVAAAVLNQLTNTKRPLAISLPVFADPLDTTGRDNWNTPIALQYGRVIDPPPTSIVIGGHAVCVVGFVPDQGEQTGGYFIFRNSWGRSWAQAVPSAQYSSPEPGYGDISATYVDKYLWEMCSL